MDFDYLNTFYSQPHDHASLFDNIDSLLQGHSGIQVKAFPCYIEKNFFQDIMADRSSLKVLNQSNGIGQFEYERIIKSKKGEETAIGKLFIVSNSNYEDIYTIITLDSSLFFSYLRDYFRNHYPRTSLTFITHNSLHKMLIGFREQNNIDELRIVRASMKSRVEQTVISSIHWTQFSLEEAFHWVKEENGWFENITFEAKKTMTPKFKISISREGVIKASNFFSAIYTSFLTPISKRVYENMKFFSKRARLENNGEIRPLCINFGYSHFDTLDENKRFISAMKRMRASSISVIHGNPFIQLSVFDYYDGSAYDLWVMSDDKIVIVPQMKSSFQAVKRLINHIFDNYYEGHIEEYAPDA
jgi:hypothetical protein